MGYGGGGGGGSGGGGGGSGGSGGGWLWWILWWWIIYDDVNSASATPPTAGAFRFNTDSSQLEIYDGNQWTGVLATSPNQQTGGTRGVLGRWYILHQHELILLNILTYDTTGNAIDFGDLCSTTEEVILSRNCIKNKRIILLVVIFQVPFNC